MNGMIERIEQFEDYLDRVKRKSGSKEPTIFFILEGAQATMKEKEETKLLRSYLTFSTVMDSILYLNANLLLEGQCNTAEDMEKFRTQTKELEAQAIDRVKKELPGCKLIRGATNFI